MNNYHRSGFQELSALLLLTLAAGCGKNGEFVVLHAPGAVDPSNPSSPSTSVTPTILSITPTSARVGDRVSIRVDDPVRVIEVTFNRVPQPSFSAGDAVLSTTVPENATSGQLLVAWQDGYTAAFANFTVLTSSQSSTNPFIRGYNPGDGPPGTEVFIDGSNFANVTKVTFGGMDASFTLADPTLPAVIIALAPANMPFGATAIAVSTHDGTTASAPMSFTATPAPAAPTITYVNPISQKVGYEVVIGMADSTGIIGVTFNGLSQPQFTVGTTVVVTSVPIGATSGPLVLTRKDGQTATFQNFSVITNPSGPNFTYVNPTAAKVGDEVDIGLDSAVGITGVTFHGGLTASIGVPAPFTAGTTVIVTHVPPGAITGDLTLTRNDGHTAVFQGFIVN